MPLLRDGEDGGLKVNDPFLFSAEAIRRLEEELAEPIEDAIEEEFDREAEKDAAAYWADVRYAEMKDDGY